MEITTISYHKVFNLGNYSNEKIGVDITVAPGENVIDAFAEAKKVVDKSHSFFQQLPKYEEALKMVSRPDDFTGREIKQAGIAIETFELNFPEYISRFIPANRQVTEGERPDYPLTFDEEHHDD